MERSAPQLYESDKDKKVSKEKRHKSDSAGKAARLLPSILPLQESGKVHSAPRRVEKELASIAEKFTIQGLAGEKPEKVSVSEAKQVRKKDNKEQNVAEGVAAVPSESTAERVRQDIDNSVDPEVRLKTAAEAEETDETDEADDNTEAYEELPEQELPRKGKALWVGETIDLNSSTEEVVMLRDTPTSEAAPAEAPAEADISNGQPEQQPEAYEEVIATESKPPVPASGEVPPIKPPENTGEAFDEPEEPEPEPEQSTLQHPAHRIPERPEPAEIYRAYMQREAALQQARAEQQGVTKEELDDAVYRATKYGQNKGVLTGLLVGGAYEHFKHKRREKKAEKRAKEQRKQLEAARRDYRFGLEQQERQQSELHARLGATERRVVSAENRLAEQPPRPPETAPQPTQQPEQASVAPPEQLIVPPEHRLETSAWLSTEIDKKTGRVVEQPSFQYGREYYRERAQETLPTQHRHAAAGGVALIGASGGAGGQSTSDSSSLPQPQIPSATMQGDPSQLHNRQATNTTSQRKLSESLANAAPLWPWVLALIGIIIVLVVVLR